MLPREDEDLLIHFHLEGEANFTATANNHVAPAYASQRGG